MREEKASILEEERKGLEAIEDAIRLESTKVQRKKEMKMKKKKKK